MNSFELSIKVVFMALNVYNDLMRKSIILKKRGLPANDSVRIGIYAKTWTIQLSTFGGACRQPTIDG